MRKIAEERHRQLRTTGRVDIPQSMGHFLLMLVFAVMFTVAGAAMIYAAVDASDPGQHALANPAFWIGLVSVSFFGVLGIPALLIQMRWRAVLTLTWDGMAEHRVKNGERVTTSATAWCDIEGFSGQYSMGVGLRRASTRFSCTCAPRGTPGTSPNCHRRWAGCSR